MVSVFAIASLVALGGSPSRAAEGAAGFSCTFRAGTTLSYTNARFKRAVAKPLAFDIAAIDLMGQKAELVTPKGRGEVKIVRALNANHFLEVVAEGFLNITTVYDFDAKAKAHPAVHSRHFGLFGEPVVAQYQGFCTPK